MSCVLSPCRVRDPFRGAAQQLPDVSGETSPLLPGNFLLGRTGRKEDREAPPADWAGPKRKRKRKRSTTSSPSCLDFFGDPGLGYCAPGAVLSSQPGRCLLLPPPPRSPQCSRERVRLRAKMACALHQEPLKLFCRDDEAPICVICDKAKEHRGHEVVPLEEAAQEYQSQIYRRLEILRKERKKILGYRADTDRESQDLLKQTEAERQKLVAEFKQLHLFLEEQEKLLLTQMEEVEKEIARKRDEQLAKLSSELSSLEKIIQEMEGKCQQPASELLQDARSTLQRSEKETFENPVAFPPALKWSIWNIWDTRLFLKGIAKQFQVMLVSGLPLQKAKVTLDPATAHPKLVLSEECRSVRVGDKPGDLPDSPARFDRLPFVLGQEGFTAGRQFWEVDVGSEGDWFVGVARKSVRRKGTFECGPEEGIWVMGKSRGDYWAFIPPHHPRLSPSGNLQRVRVALNCAGGQVAFFDADSEALLFTFSEAPFSGETILPFFYLNPKAHLRLSP